MLFIDISNYQKGLIDFNRVPHSGEPSGVDGFLIRSSFTYNRELVVDAAYDNFRDKARENNFLLGFYHTIEPGVHSAETEAKYFSTIINNNIKDGERVALDWEDNGSFGQGGVDYIAEMVKKIKEETGITCMVYMNKSALYKYDWSKIRDLGCELWLAVGDGVSETRPDGNWFVVRVKQYALDANSYIPGISGNIDYNTVWDTPVEWKAGGKVTPPEPDVIKFVISGNKGTFEDEKSARDEFKKLKEVIEPGVTITLSKVNILKNESQRLDIYTKPLPEPIPAPEPEPTPEPAPEPQKMTFWDKVEKFLKDLLELFKLLFPQK